MEHEPHNIESIDDTEALEESPEVSLGDRNNMQIALARRMNMDLREWIDLYSKDFGDIVDEDPELASGFSGLEPKGKTALKALDDMIDALENRAQRRKAA